MDAIWTTLIELRPGALLETRDGVRGVVVAYQVGDAPDGYRLCVLLADGSRVLKPEQTSVRELAAQP